MSKLKTYNYVTALPVAAALVCASIPSTIADPVTVRASKIGNQRPEIFVAERGAHTSHAIYIRGIYESRPVSSAMHGPKLISSTSKGEITRLRQVGAYGTVFFIACLSVAISNVVSNVIGYGALLYKLNVFGVLVAGLSGFAAAYFAQQAPE